jgi:UDP-3-O-[3-hydroxymyristoyl] glucosamine N-acyltransferase
MSECFKSDYIAQIVDGFTANKEVIVDNFSSLSDATSTSVSFFNDPRLKKELLSTKAALVILKKHDENLCSKPTIIVDDPYLAFAKVSSIFQKNNRIKKIHESVVIFEKVTLGSDVGIEPYVFIDSNVKIGDGTFIGSNTRIGSNVVIGSNVIIHPNVYIGSDVKIGNNCEIFPGAKIGTDGFGYARDKNKKWLKIPQTGSVIIGDNVDIGANTTIDRGAIDNTIIHNGVKIDNLVQIGHNCIIGENSIIAGCAGIAGSAKIGKNCMIGGAAMIKGHITIADDTIISGGTGIGKNVENSGKRFTNVFPYNLEHKDWLRIANNLKKLGKKND